MPEWGTYGSGRGVFGNGHSYRDTSQLRQANLQPRNFEAVADA